MQHVIQSMDLNFWNTEVKLMDSFSFALSKMTATTHMWPFKKIEQSIFHYIVFYTPLSLFLKLFCLNLGFCVGYSFMNKNVCQGFFSYSINKLTISIKNTLHSSQLLPNSKPSLSTFFLCTPSPCQLTLPNLENQKSLLCLAQ